MTVNNLPLLDEYGEGSCPKPVQVDISAVGLPADLDAGEYSEEKSASRTLPTNCFPIMC